MPFRYFPVLLVIMLMAACSSRAGVYHTVKKGQTLYTISRTYQVDESYLARINGIANPSQLKAGQQLYIPGRERIRHVPVTVHSPPPPKSSREKSPGGPVADHRPTVTQPKVASAAPAKAPPKTAPNVAHPASARGEPPKDPGRFLWPARGKILKKYGAGKGVGSKGLEIGLPVGSTVSCAAAGKVIYSGDGITGYGNLVIVRHDDSFFTVYGFNRKNLVKNGDFVSKGEKIALSGVPPKGGTPRLYFEIRYGKKPVNPIFYLP